MSAGPHQPTGARRSHHAHRQRPPRAALPHVAVWGLLGALSTVVVLAAGLDDPVVRLGEWWVLPVAVVAAIVLSGISITIPVSRRAASDVSLSEAAFVAAVVLLHPAWAVLVLVLGEAVAQVLTRRHPLKLVFNLGWSATAAALGALFFDALWAGPVTELSTALGALLAALVYSAVNLFAVVGVTAVAGERPAVEILRESGAGMVEESVSVSSLGIVATALLLTAPWLLPALLAPLLLVRARSRSRARLNEALADERDRFERTIAGASDGIVLVDRDDRMLLWNQAAAAIAGVSDEPALGRRITDQLELLDPSGTSLSLGARLASCRTTAAPVSFSATVPATGRTLVVRAAPGAHTAGTAASEVVLVLHDVTDEEALNRMRDDLVMRVSHELRTPLTTSIGFLETALARWEDLPDHRRRELLEVAHRATKRLGRLVARLLTQSQIEGGARAQARPVVLGAAVDAIVADLQGSLRLPVRFTDRSAGVRALVDPGHLQEIVENLLTNADRYGHGRVDVTVLDTGGEVAVEVRDHGEGVPPEFVPHLFDAFTQASVGTRRTATGLGVGLANVRALVDANAGQVTYDDASGGGALFTVRLPIAPGDAGDEPATPRITDTAPSA